MDLVLSPYHLTTREPAAMASLLLADSVVTLLPVPFAGETYEDVRRASRTSPKYMRFMESWEWSSELWREGAIASTYAGDDPADDAREVHRLLRQDPRFRPLRPILRETLYADESSYLDLVASDLLKGGPDPGISVPVAAGLDRFASRHALAVVRSEAVSVAQRAEARLGRRLFAIGVPVLLQASGDRILDAREALAPELGLLRDAFDAHLGDESDLRDAGRDYARAFERARDALLASDDEVRAVEGAVSLTGVALPADAALRSSMAAMRSLAIATGPEPTVGDLPVLFDEASGREVLAIVVRKMGRRR
jgi:hypothetical protein